MKLVKVNVVCAQVPQAGGHVRLHSLPGQPPALGSQDEFVPNALKGIAQIFLTDGVAPGGIDVVNARFHEFADQRFCPFRVNGYTDGRVKCRKLVEETRTAFSGMRKGIHPY